MTNHLPMKKQNNIVLKLIALGIGYLFWHIFGASHSTISTLSVPVCFYNVPAHMQLAAPETINVTLTGKRSALRTLDREQLALHIDAARLKPGKNLLNLKQEDLLLPHTIRLVQYAPSNPIVDLIPSSER